MRVAMQGITRRFGQTLAVDGVDFEARAGEVTALLGENGAGKSTLMKLLYGVHVPEAGRITLDGETVTISSPRDAMQRGIGMVFQQFSLIPALTVRENLALVLHASPWWIGSGARRLDVIGRHLASVVPEVDPEQRVAGLAVGQMQLIELAKVLLLDARCIILDEPSAVLAPSEAARLWSMMRELAARGLSVVLITHKLHDVKACADRVFVMRGGRLAGQAEARGLDDADIALLMVGHAPPPAREPLPIGTAAPTRLELRRASAGSARDLDLQLRSGEVVGVAGVSGNGQTDLADAVAGLLPLDAGEILLDGARLRASAGARPSESPNAADAPNRIGYIPEQPLVNAIAPALSLWLNLALKRIAGLPFLPDFAALQSDARALIRRFDVRPPDPNAEARWLSGGNLQKLVAARELSAGPAVVVACYPTMGLDITATAQVYEALFDQARQGSAVLWISEELDDLLRYAHRIAVMLDGRIVKVLDGHATSLAEIGACMAGSEGPA